MRRNLRGLIFIESLPFIFNLYPFVGGAMVGSQGGTVLGKYSLSFLVFIFFSALLYFLIFLSFLKQRILIRFVALILLLLSTMISTANLGVLQLSQITTIWWLIRVSIGVSILLIAWECFVYKKRVTILVLICGSLIIGWTIADLFIPVCVKMIKQRKMSAEGVVKAPLSAISDLEDHWMVRNGVKIFRNALNPKDRLHLSQEYLDLYPLKDGDLVIVGDSMVNHMPVPIDQLVGNHLQGLLDKNSLRKRAHVLAQGGIGFPEYNILLNQLPLNVQFDRIFLGVYFNDMSGATDRLYDFVASYGSPTLHLFRDIILKVFVLPKNEDESLVSFHKSMAKSFDKNNHTYLQRYTGFISQIAEFYEGAKKRSLHPPVLIIFPLTVSYKEYPLEQAHKDIAQSAQDIGFEVLDLLSIFRNKMVDGAKIRTTPIDNHYNGEANRVVAEAIFNILRNK